MFENATREQLEAIRVIKSHPEMPLFIAALDNELRAIDKALRTAPLQNIEKLQGKAITLQHLSSFFTNK